MLIGLTPDAVAGIIDKLNSKKFDEPVASMNDCDFEKLVSTLKTPFQRPKHDNHAQDFAEKASLLFYLLTENHCFKNSNKRIAVTALNTFAKYNSFTINISEISLYGLAMAITLLAKYHLVKEAQYEVMIRIKESLSRQIPESFSNEEKKLMEKEFEDFLVS